MSAVLLFLRGVPILAYVCGVLFLGAAFERHEATRWKNEVTLVKAADADAKIKALEDAKTESDRRIAALQGEVNDAKTRADALAAHDAAATAAAGRVSGELAAVRKRFAADNPAAPGELAAARAAVGVLADLLGERQRAGAARSRFADKAASGGAGCEHQYDSLTPSATQGSGLHVR